MVALAECAQGVGREGVPGIDGRVRRFILRPFPLVEASPTFDFRDEAFLPEVTARLAIEAASPFGWERYVGPKGDVIGIKRYGGSAPHKVIAEKFGFTAANAAERARALLGKA